MPSAGSRNNDQPITAANAEIPNTVFLYLSANGMKIKATPSPVKINSPICKMFAMVADTSPTC